MGLLNSARKVSNGLKTGAAQYAKEAVAGDLSKASSLINKNLSKTKNSIETIKKVSSKLDDVLGTGVGDFVNTTLGSLDNQIELNRLASTLSGKKYNTMVNPVTKLGSTGNKDFLQYPPDLGEYYLEFVFMKYSRPNPYKPAKEEKSINIYLPVPAALVESHSTKWSEADQGVFGNIMNDLMSDGADTSLQSYGYAMADAILGNSTLNKLTLGLAGEAAKKLDVIQQALGAIPNPNISLLFQGPTLRSFPFTWRFHPESAEESNKIREIISTFRSRILPNTRGNSGVLTLGYPDMLTVKLHPDDHLYKMKKCIVENMTINYAPNGVPSFFKGTKAPTMIEFTLYLKEIEYFLADDFDADRHDLDTVDWDNISSIFGLDKEETPTI